MVSTLPYYCMSGEEVHVGDRVRSVEAAEGLGRVVFVSAREEYARDYPADEWHGLDGVMVEHDNGMQSFWLYPGVDLELIERGVS